MCVKPTSTYRDFFGYQDQNKLSEFSIRFLLEYMYWCLTKNSDQWQNKHFFLKHKFSPSPRKSSPKKKKGIRQMFCFLHLLIFAQHVRLLRDSSTNDIPLWPFSVMQSESKRKIRKLYLQCKLFCTVITSSLIFQLRHS